MSKKLTERQISYRQYRLADLMVFLLIMCVCETVNIFATKYWFPGMLFTISVMLLVSLIMLIRWNLFGVMFPVIDGLLYCWMNGAGVVQFVVYSIGNAFISLVWLIFLLVSKEKVASAWYFTILYALAGFVLMLLGRSVVAICFGYNFGSVFMTMLKTEMLNLAFAVVGLLIVRLFNGMLSDQKKYLIKVSAERDAINHVEEYHWDGYTELNEEDLRLLAAMDEYDRALNFNSRSLHRIKKNDGHEIGESDCEAQVLDEERDDELKELSELDSE